MYVKKIDNYDEISLWIAEHNQAFKNRRSTNIPYKEVKRENLIIDSNNSILGVYNNDQLLGGAYISYCIGYGNVKNVKVGHVWIEPRYQKRGVGSFLIEEIENIALQDGRELLQLNVANIYLPAVHLYRKNGFKDLIIYANIPRTYYFIRMIKEVGTYKFSERKRLYMLIKSAIIFKILYKRDSSPTMINKMIYGKEKKY